MCTNYLLDTIYGRRISEALGRKLSSHPAVGPHLAPHTSGHPLAFHLLRLVRAGNEQDFGRHFYRFFSIGPRWGGGRLAGFNGAEASQAANTCVFRRGRPCSLWTSQTSCVSASRVTTTEKVKVSGLGTFHLPRCVELLLIETEQLTLKVSHPRAMRAFRWSPVMSLTC